ncbi:MAG: hypothetical protein J1F36_01880 [Clostridiales bacterium]|nr:hypothetical protein [Clostridiales bacterium]
MDQQTGKIILKTALITTGAVLLAGVIIAVLISFCFPYQGYKMTSDLGMKKSALYFAERYADKGNIDGLVYCIGLDEELMSNGKNKYAQKMISHTESFYDFENIDSYFAQLDSYYISNSPRQAHIGLFSYEEYIVSRNYYARAIVGKEDEMLFRGKPTKLDKLFTDDTTDIEKAIIYSAIYRALSNSSDFEPLIQNNSFTNFYYTLTNSITPYIVGLSGNDLQTLFLMRSVIYLVGGVNTFLQAHNLSMPEWQGFLDLEVQGKSLNKAYADMFLEYINE